MCEFVHFFSLQLCVHLQLSSILCRVLRLRVRWHGDGWMPSCCWCSWWRGRPPSFQGSLPIWIFSVFLASRLILASGRGVLERNGADIKVPFEVSHSGASFCLVPYLGEGGRQQRRLNQGRNSERCSPSSASLSLSASFCLHPLFSIHRRAGAFGAAKEDFWQGSLWEDRYEKGGRLSKSIPRSLILCPSLCFLDTPRALAWEPDE